MDGFHDLKKIKPRSVELIIHRCGNLSEQFLVKRANVLDKLNPEDVQPDKLNSICSSYDHLTDINFPDFDNNQVSILIGNDNIDLVTSQALIKGPENAPRAISKPLGWTIVDQMAKILGNSVFRAYSSHDNDINEDAHLFEFLASTWGMETYGTSPDITLSKDEKNVHENFRQTIAYTEGSYQLGLIWKPNACLPNNFFAAAHQFNKMKTRPLNDPDKLAMYLDTITKI